jgi:hypothetical protein
VNTGLCVLAGEEYTQHPALIIADFGFWILDFGTQHSALSTQHSALGTYKLIT